MPTYRTTNRRNYRASGRGGDPSQTGNLHVFETFETPQTTKKPFAIITIIAVAIVVALVAAIAFALGGKAETKVDENAAPLGGTTFTESLPEETIAIVDDVVMTMAGSKDTYVLAGEEYLEAGCQATDSEVGDITSSVTIESDVDTSKPGDYTVTYTATTADGAQAQATRNVHVVEAFDAAAKDIPVLMYHYVYDANDAPADLNGNYILNTKLAAECEYLRDNDYYYPSFEELRAWVDGTHTLPAKSVVLTFDDGEMGFLKYGIPVLEEYEVPATSFVVAKDAAQNVIDYASPYVQFESHSYDMHRGGGGAGQGGIIHALSKQEIYDDIMASNQVTGANGAVALAYPFGDNHETAWAALEDAGILCAFTVKNDRISPGDNPMALNRVRLSGEYSVDSFIALVAPTV